MRIEHNQTLRPYALNALKFNIEYYAADTNELVGRESLRRESSVQYVTLSDPGKLKMDPKTYRVKITTLLENTRNETLNRQERSDVVRCAAPVGAEAPLGGLHPLVSLLLCSLVIVMLMMVAFFVWFVVKKRLNATPTYLRSFKKKKTSCFRATPFRAHRDLASNNGNCYNLYTPNREAQGLSRMGYGRFFCYFF